MQLDAPAIRESFGARRGRVVRDLEVCGAEGESWCSTRRSSDDVELSSLQSEFDQAQLRGQVEHATGPNRRSVLIADVFCGAGGLSHGVREAVLGLGMTPKYVLAADSNPVAVDVYRRNFDPAHHTSRNIWTSVTTHYSCRNGKAKFLSKPRLLDEPMRSSAGSVDILLGGPPCEGHSMSNNVSRSTDPRNVYYVAMPALAVALGAKGVIIENVPGVRRDRRRILDEAKALFASEDYQVDEAIIDATDLGLPQTRKRHILVASRVRQPDLDAAAQAVARPKRDLRWAIGDLVDQEPHDLMDKPAKLSKANRERIEFLFQQVRFDLPNDWRPDCHKDGHTYPSIYGRLRWDKPSGTITTGFNTPGRGRFIHPELKRTITPHEAARIQGFPDSFEFRKVSGEALSRTHVSKMIGGAVPPQIGYVAGLAALAALL